ncbi:uncharacterized protein K452DRAFT_360782 [Aplosporella prunicola CBS 121167]|uniref:RNA 3'-terminal phosphate cyclase domain-containing protein n=1 Tax=Aplosporella prunicola CBS 121167 TaxID=1176127 RepID=A0A6A6B5Z3_9PEZI|nr:uncharacterized protein K452DRAFT_360782 [Aplosporella prunicola CBS 121167]KAF2139048.1 hypothetical protein K452DRAFT_360782 [Aplosporella prunicola CBS 121167]
MEHLVLLDGTTLEGGGQLLRMALGLAALTTRPIRITDIRGKRRGGSGLKLQHLAAVHWFENAAYAQTLGAEKGSRNLDFFPDTGPDSRAKAHMAEEVDIGSPGSIGLVFQAILPFIVFLGHTKSTEPFRVCIRGGTNVSLSPSLEYIQQVLLPTLLRIGLPPITVQLGDRCWAGPSQERGSVIFEITPLPLGMSLPAFTFRDRGDIESIKATILAPSSCYFQAEREIHEAIQTWFPALAKESLSIELSDSGKASHLYLLLVATSTKGYKIARDWLYNKKVVSLPRAITLLIRQVSSELAAEINHGGCVDEYMRDQLVIFQALSSGYSSVDGGKDNSGKNVVPSLHTQTAKWVAQRLLGVHFDEEGGCHGVGLAAGEQFSKRENSRGDTQK